MNEVDKAVVEGAAALQRIFGSLSLSPEERAFVNDAGAKVARYVVELYGSVPTEAQQHLRTVVVVVALASILGPPEPGDYGTDVLRTG